MAPYRGYRSLRVNFARQGTPKIPRTQALRNKLRQISNGLRPHQSTNIELLLLWMAPEFLQTDDDSLQREISTILNADIALQYLLRYKASSHYDADAERKRSKEKREKKRAEKAKRAG